MAEAEHFSYDQIGNLRGNRVAEGGVNQTFGGTRPHAITQTASGSTFEYDDDGNLTSEQGPGGTKHYKFDSQNRLACAGPTAGSCSTLEVVYEPSGARVRDRFTPNPGGATFDRFYAGELFTKTGGQADLFIFALGEQIASKRVVPVVLRTSDTFGLPWEPPGSWSEPLGVVLLLALGSMGLLVLIQRSPEARRRPGLATLALVVSVAVAVPPLPLAAGGGGQQAMWRRWLLADPLGSMTTVVRPDGTVERETTYKPFGTIHDNSGFDGTGRTIFAGHPSEPMTGLQYMRARWQNPQTGTFLSVDPINFARRVDEAHGIVARVAVGVERLRVRRARYASSGRRSFSRVRKSPKGSRGGRPK